MFHLTQIYCKIDAWKSSLSSYTFIVNIKNLLHKKLLITIITVLSFGKAFSQNVQSDSVSKAKESQLKLLVGNLKGAALIVDTTEKMGEFNQFEKIQLKLDSTTFLIEGIGKIKSHKMEKQKILGLRTTIYKVDDIEKAKKWYTQAIGVKPYFDQPFYVGFNIGGYELGLQPEEKSSTEKTESVVSYWGVENIEEVYQHLIENGAIDNEKPCNVGGDIMTATVKDPWGNIIGFVYNPEFKVNDGE